MHFLAKFNAFASASRFKFHVAWDYAGLIVDEV